MIIDDGTSLRSKCQGCFARILPGLALIHKPLRSSELLRGGIWSQPGTVNSNLTAATRASPYITDAIMPSHWQELSKSCVCAACAAADRPPLIIRHWARLRIHVWCNAHQSISNSRQEWEIISVSITNHLIVLTTELITDAQENHQV